MAEKHTSLSLTQELAQLDERLVGLIAARTNLLSRAAASRRAKNLGITDPNQEKALWQVWRDSSKGDNLEPQILKKIFHLTNNLSYARVERNSQNDKPLCLFPRRKPVNIDLNAPRDQILRSMMFFMGAINSTPLTVAPFQGNDISLELTASARPSLSGPGPWTTRFSTPVKASSISIFCSAWPWERSRVPNSRVRPNSRSTTSGRYRTSCRNSARG